MAMIHSFLSTTGSFKDSLPLAEAKNLAENHRESFQLCGCHFVMLFRQGLNVVDNLRTWSIPPDSFFFF